MVVILAVVDANMPRRAVKRIRQNFRKKLRDISELKAAQTPARVVLKLLQRVVQSDLEIFAVVVDKQKAFS